MAILEALELVRKERELRRKRAQWQNDPVLWAKERLNKTLWSKQVEIALSVLHNKKTAVKSCHAIGKTYLAAIIVCWWIDTHPVGVRVLTTAPTDNQVKKLLWEYIRKIHRENNLSGTVNENAEWHNDLRDTVGQGRKPSDENMHAFQGFHDDYVLVILDEACGVAKQFWTAIEAVTTGPNDRILAIGNPDDPVTEFGNIWLKKYTDWNKITVSAFDTPKFTDEWKELPEDVYKNLIEPDWVEDKRNKWGEGTARWNAKILAEFPKDASETFFPITVLDEAMDRQTNGTLRQNPSLAGKHLGVDVARFGPDFTTLILNDNGRIEVLASWNSTDTMTTAKMVHDHAVQHEVDTVRVDVVGVGGGVFDRLNELNIQSGYPYMLYGMNGGNSSPDPTRWLNARAYWHDWLLGCLRDGYVGLPATNGNPEAEKLYTELEGIRYTYSPSGNKGIKIESKAEIKARGGKSPDFSDGLVLAVALVDVQVESQGVPDEYDTLVQRLAEELPVEHNYLAPY